MHANPALPLVRGMPMTTISHSASRRGKQANGIGPGATEALLEDAVSAAADWVWETNEVLRVVRIFPAFAEGSRMPPADLTGRSLDDLVSRFHADETEQERDRLTLAAGLPFRNLSLHVWDPAGERIRHFLLSGRPFRDGEGKFAGYRGVGLEAPGLSTRAAFNQAAQDPAVVEPRDVTSEANPALLAMCGKVMDASQEAVVILSPTGHILYANQSYGSLFACSLSEAVQCHYREFFPPDSQAALDGEVAPTLMRGESWEGVLDACDRRGRRFPLWQRSGTVRNEDGRVCFFFAFMHDHSAQQLFEDQLVAAKEVAEEASVAKTRFLAAASHDLRQPMQALAMFVGVLSTRNRDPEQAVLINRVHDSVVALEGLLNGLLDVSKLEAGLVIPHVGDFPIVGLMKRLHAEFEPVCEAAGLRLGMVPTRVAVHSDAALLERILRNLLNNAVRYTKRGRILFGCRRHGKSLRIEVWDTGIGIPAAELRNIFREFHQVGNQGRDRRQGLGLGLAIVERLANLLGHRVEVHSEEGKGSMFAVELPLAVVPIAQDRPRQLQLGLATTGAAILIVEDEPDVRESLRLLLESWGHFVVAASSGEDAIRRLPALGRRPDLVLADYRLQNGETGGQAIARIEEHLGISLPAIIVTGDTAPERLRQAQALGHGLLHKPVQAASLRAAIDGELARALRLRRRAQRGRPAPRKAASQ
jgi:PAS domain S-box-containing protein